jgi:preprotein translocase subunit YajC
MAAQVLTQELSVVETLPQPRSDLLRYRRALIQGLQNDVRAFSSTVRYPRQCIPTNNQLEACYASCSELKCVDSSCKTSRSTCGEPGCCRASISNGSATVITECYKDCCYAVDDSMDYVKPIPCTGAVKDGAGKSKSNKKCFPGGALVELESGVTQRMDRLHVGDRVKVAPGMFSDVFMFTHKLETSVHNFLNIRTACGNRIRLTAGHYIYANGILVPAGMVQQGDELTLASGAHCAVISVSETFDVGLYNPQTLEGNIVVDGVMASTYTTAVTPTFGHAWLAPLRKLYLFFGLSSRLLENGADAAADCLPVSITANLVLP